MSFWNELGISGKREKEYSHAFLKVNSESGVIEKKFRFSDRTNDTIIESSSIMPIESEVHTSTIRTSFYWLPFCKGAMVRFADGEELKITGVKKLYDENKALTDGVGLVGLEITF